MEKMTERGEKLMKQKRLLCFGMVAALSCANLPPIIAYAQEETMEGGLINLSKETESVRAE